MIDGNCRDISENHYKSWLFVFFYHGSNITTSWFFDIWPRIIRYIWSLSLCIYTAFIVLSTFLCCALSWFLALWGTKKAQIVLVFTSEFGLQLFISPMQFFWLRINELRSHAILQSISITWATIPIHSLTTFSYFAF